MVQIQILLQSVKCGEISPWHKAEWWKILWTTVGIFNAAAASWEKNPKLGFGGAATQIPTPIIGQYDGDGNDFDDDYDDYLYIMMKCALVCLWVMKNDHFLKKISWPPQECQKMITISRRYVGSPCESQKMSTFTI